MKLQISNSIFNLQCANGIEDCRNAGTVELKTYNVHCTKLKFVKIYINYLVATSKYLGLGI